jgi:hypothetical protein
VALVHFQMEGEMAPTPSCYAVTGWRRTEAGRPATNIRFSTAAPMAASGLQTRAVDQYVHWTMRH